MDAPNNPGKSWADMIEEAEYIELKGPPARRDIVTYDQAPQKETDPHRLAQRQKQIDFGKNTVGYQNYITAVPKSKRDKHKHPSTPDVNVAVGKRQWDGAVKAWRRRLHEWDTQEGQEPVELAPVPNTSTRKREPPAAPKPEQPQPAPLPQPHHQRLHPRRAATAARAAAQDALGRPPKPLHSHSGSASGKKRAFDAAFDTASSAAARSQRRASSESGPQRPGSALGRSMSRSMTVSPVEGAGGGLPRAGSARSLGAGSSDWEKVVEVAPAGSDDDDWQNVL